jgi:serralysin
MPIQPEPWHGEFRPNLGNEVEGANFPDDTHDGPNNVTALTNGGFVATWHEIDAGNNLRIRAQLYNALGGRVGSEIAVNTNIGVGHDTENNANDGHIFDVAALPGGGFVVTWARQEGAGDVVFQRFSSTGAKLGGETNVEGAAGAVDREWDPSIAMLANGNFVVTWVDDPFMGNADIRGTVYTPAGALVANGTNLNLTSSFTSTVGGFPSDNEVAATADGNFVVALRILDDVRYGKTSLVSAGGGEPSFVPAPLVQVSTQATGDQGNPAVAGLSNGGWAVAYIDERTTSDHDIHLRVYNSAGVVVATVPLANTTSLERSPSIAAGPDGTFLVTWDRWIATGDRDDPAEVDVLGQLFSNNGTAIGDVFQVNTVETRDSGRPVATALNDGRYAVAFVRDDALRFPGDAHTFVQILDGRDATITGNGINDTLVGHDIGQSILNDNIMGFGGNDTLHGLAGNDTLNGGTGNDRMVGGPGNDTYFVDSLSDTVVEAANAGIDRVISSVTLTLGANVENLILTGAASLRGTGNGLANAITGNGGANLLTGFAGNDQLRGGAGNDLLTGGLGRDILTGDLGADRFDFNSVAESLRGSARDTVNFQRTQGDKIDLSTIDADRDGTAGNQAFRFIGGTAFHGKLRFSGGILQGDTNGDTIADIEIRVVGALIRGDIIL